MLNFLKRSIVPKGVVETLGQSHPYTPDYYELEMKRAVLLFVADEMMKGHRNELDPASSDLYGTAYTQDHFLMLKKSLGKRTYPVITPKDVAVLPGNLIRHPAAPVRGLLYKVAPEYIVELDNFKQNGDTFNRQEVLICVPFRKKLERTFSVGNDKHHKIEYHEVFGAWELEKDIKAFMYVADPRHFAWDFSLEPMRCIEPTDRLKKPFYCFDNVNGDQTPSHRHQPNYPPLIRSRPDTAALKKQLLQKHGENRSFKRQQAKRVVNEQVELPLK